MPCFAYEARNDNGELVGGMIVADGLADAGRKLSERNLFVVKLGATDDAGVDRARAREEASRLRASRKHVMWFMNQMAIMIETGITIGEALRILARQATDPVMKEILLDVSESVQEGRPFSDALLDYPRTFPQVVTAMIRASEASGTLSLVLNRVADYLLKDQQALGRLRSALVYPAFMFLMCTSVTVFLLTVILPRFATIYATKGAALPAPTRILLGLSEGMLQYGLYLLAGLALLVAAFLRWRSSPSGRAVLDRAQIALPLFGTLFSNMYQSRTFRAVGTLLDAGVAIRDALDLAKGMSTNSRYRDLWERAEQRVVNGDRIAAPLADSGLLDESVVHMIECGDRTGRLGFVFIRLADFIEQEYDRAVKAVSQLLEPLMILFMGGLIGFVAIAMLLPMFRAASVVSR